MYETVISVGVQRIDWLKETDTMIRSSSDPEIVTACSAEKRFAYLCVGADGRAEKRAAALVKRALTELFLGREKKSFLSAGVEKLRIAPQSRKLLVHALTGFDRDVEERMMKERLRFRRFFDIDGFRSFRMREFYVRWKEMCDLAGQHGSFLLNENTFNDLLRFLIDASKKRDSRALVIRSDGRYRLVEKRGNALAEEKTFDVFEDLLCGLIDFAPCETVLKGFDYDEDYRRLNNIFDVTCDISQ